MIQDPHLQYLFTHPQLGYLYPHKFAVAALGLPNEYQLSKHRPKLTPEQHYLKLRGHDHIDRLYYTVDGIRLLATLIGTPQAQTFWQDLLQLIQSAQRGSAIVPTTPTDLVYEPVVTVEAPPYRPVSEWYPTPTPPVADPYPLAPRSVTSPEIPVLNAVPIPPTRSSNPSSSIETLQQTTALQTAQIILAAQRQNTQTILQAQAQQASELAKQPTQIHLTFTAWDNWSRWIEQQDLLAVLAIGLCLSALTGLAAWFALSSLTRPLPNEPISTPTAPAQVQPN